MLASGLQDLRCEDLRVDAVALGMIPTIAATVHGSSGCESGNVAVTIGGA